MTVMDELHTDLEPVVDRALRPPPRQRQGVVPARVRPVEPRPRLRCRRAVGPGRGAGLRAGPGRADGEPADRGQPAVLLRVAERRSAVPGQRLGAVDAALDRRGGPPRDRDPRLPHRDPLGRPGRARAGAHAAGEDGGDPEVRHGDRRARVHDAPGARDTDRAPQHRRAARGPRRAGGHAPSRGRREPPPPLLPGPRERDDRPRPVGDGGGDGARRARRSRCRAPGSPTSPGTPAPSRRRRLRLLDPLRPDHRSHRDAAWSLTEITGLDAEAEHARDRLVRFIDRLGKAAARTEAKREARGAGAGRARDFSG